MIDENVLYNYGWSCRAYERCRLYAIDALDRSRKYDRASTRAMAMHHARDWARRARCYLKDIQRYKQYLLEA
jgi:hypothetical protein